MVEFRWAVLHETKFHEYLLRFVAGGTCTAIAGVIAKKYGPVLGGLFLAFPAIFPASASLIESHEKKHKEEIGADGSKRGRMAAALDAAGAALGCLGLVLFALTMWAFLPRITPTTSIILAAVVWLVSVVLLWELRKRRIFGRRKPRHR